MIRKFWKRPLSLSSLCVCVCVCVCVWSSDLSHHFQLVFIQCVSVSKASLVPCGTTIPSPGSCHPRSDLCSIFQTDLLASVLHSSSSPTGATGLFFLKSISNYVTHSCTSQPPTHPRLGMFDVWVLFSGWSPVRVGGVLGVPPTPTSLLHQPHMDHVPSLLRPSSPVPPQAFSMWGVISSLPPPGHPTLPSWGTTSPVLGENCTSSLGCSYYTIKLLHLVFLVGTGLEEWNCVFIWVTLLLLSFFSANCSSQEERKQRVFGAHNACHIVGLKIYLPRKMTE